MTVILRTEWKSRRIEISPEPEGIASLEDTTDPISCDIELGGIYKNPGSNRSDDIPPHGFVLKPGRLVIAESLQSLVLPNNVTGIICSKAKQTYKGLIGPNTKIDPHFRGALKLALFNAGDQPILLKMGESVCSMFFLSMDNGGGTERWLPKDKSLRHSEYSAMVRRNTPHLYTLALSLLGASLVYTVFSMFGKSAQVFWGNVFSLFAYVALRLIAMVDKAIPQFAAGFGAGIASTWLVRRYYRSGANKE